MRSFEERKAEIFRRSEERIRERKRNRNRILSFCIPVCLILCIWSAFTLPSVFSSKDKNMIPEKGMDIVGSTDLTGGTYIQTECLSDESTFFLSDVLKVNVNEVERLCDIFDSFLPDGEESVSDGICDEEEKKENSAQSSSGEFSSGYRITFVKEGNVSEIYTLKGSVLTEEKTNRKVILTEDQKALILEELGLTEEEED